MGTVTALLILRYGAQYGGPNFDEAGPHSKLQIEEYFHTETSAPLKEDSNGERLAEELEFDRDSNPSAFKWCSHVDPVLLTSTVMALYPRCGLGSYRPADGLGLISSFSTSGGHFVYDGLVTTVDRWFRAHWLKKRRFRFVGHSAVGAEGDVRLFVLSPSPSSNRSAIPVVATWFCSASCFFFFSLFCLLGSLFLWQQTANHIEIEDLGSCTQELGCRDSSAVLCSCVAVCSESVLRWAVVAAGKLLAWKKAQLREQVF